MSATKVSVIAFAMCACLVVVQAAGGIKGGFNANDSQQRASAKSPFRPPVQQQQYLPPPPPQQQQVLLPPPPPQQPQVLLPAPPPPRPVVAAPVKGPVFTAARVAPVAPPPPPPAPIVQQQQIIQQQEQEPEPQQIVQQTQQQQEEIEPNPAAQDNLAAIAAPARVAAPAVIAPVALAAASEEEANPRPEPYAFQYAFESGDSATSGSSQREEQQDASGRVTGFYTLKGEDGRDRRVDYVADASGFHATISTNELGTAPKDSADAVWNAQAASEGQLRVAESATQAARQRALQNPQPQSAASSSFSSLSSPAANGHHSSSARQNGHHLQSARQNGAQAASSLQQQLAASPSAGKANLQSQQAQQQQISQQLQEPFEQIRQVELNGRARKSRHAPFYLFTV